jgi:hypothetical protein
MKILLVGISALICLVTLLITGCSTPVYTIGTGPVVDKQFAFNDFDRLEIANNFHYDIRQSQDYLITVSTHANIVEHLDVYQINRTVFIKLAEPHSYSNTDAGVVIKMPQLSSIRISGASKGKISGFESANPFNADISGASHMDLRFICGIADMQISGASQVSGYFKAGNTKLIVSGASRCEIQGSVAAAKIEVSGASRVETPDLIAQSADVQVSGASRAVINTDGNLSITANGASNVYYLGYPDMQRMDITGASHLARQ